MFLFKEKRERTKLAGWPGCGTFVCGSWGRESKVFKKRRLLDSHIGSKSKIDFLNWGAMAKGILIMRYKRMRMKKMCAIIIALHG